MIDPKILQLLIGSAGGESTPVSGIGGGTPLSGLMLGEQGMGFGGGGGMLAGQGGGAGQPMGGGGDLSQLLAMLQGAGGGGESGVGSGAPTLGQGGGGALGAGFGAGGQLLPQQATGLPQGTIGQAGVGGVQSAGQIIGSIKELLGLGRTIGGALPSQPGGVPTSPITASPMGLDRTFPPDQFNLGQLMTAGDALPGFPAGAVGTPGLGGGTFSPMGNILPGLPPPTEFLGPGGSPAGAGELGPAAGQGAGTGNLFGGTGGFGAGLGALGGLAGALTAPNDPTRAFSSLAAAGSLASFLDPTGISEILALIGGGGGLLSGLFGGLFGGGHPKVDVQVPGYAFPISQTLGGARTSWKSYGEGVGALSPFEQALQAARTPESLVAAFNQQYSPFPGQFRVESHGPQSFTPGEGNVPAGTPGAWDFMNLGGTPFSSWSPWTAAALQNPAVLANLDIQAGALGAPAEQPQVAQQVQQYLTSLIGTPFWPTIA